jgi:glycosyltransferase involved in cell wall biosynthesis
MGRPCGIADYTKELSNYISSVDKDILIGNIKTGTPHPCDTTYPDLLWSMIENSNIMHYQLEYGLFSKDDILKAKSFLDGKIIGCTQHAIDEVQFEYNALIGNIFNFIVVHSQEMADVAVDIGYPEEKIKVIPHGCWDYGLKPKQQESRIKKIGSFGFLFPQKGWIETSIAISRLKDYEWNLYSSKVPGHTNSEKYETRFTEFLHRLDSTNIIWHSEFMPELDIINALRDMDLIIIPYTVFNNQHAISGAARRCIATGVPVMCTDVTYFSDLEDEVYKIPNYYPETIMEGIVYLDKNKEKRENMVIKADKFLKDNSWDNIARKHVDLWKGL